MSNRAGDMTPQMMVLGAVAAEPGTAKEIQKRLVDLWPAADFDRNAAHTNLPLLEEAGHVRLLEEGAAPAQNRYEITEAGWEHIREWVSRWPPDPRFREAIHGKAAFARLEDLPEIVRMARAQQERFQTESDKAQGKLLSMERLQAKVPPRNLDEELSAAINLAHLRDMTLYWGDLAARREKYADELQEIHQRFATKARQANEER
ncbi:MAG TPA: hypothetical protein VED41_05290 [Solirubrobacteraceae bacterium]|nr:hypothetical protein [Solirubrobacteraceae bacterium]